MKKRGVRPSVQIMQAYSDTIVDTDVFFGWKPTDNNYETSSKFYDTTVAQWNFQVESIYFGSQMVYG